MWTWAGLWPTCKRSSNYSIATFLVKSQKMPTMMFDMHQVRIFLARFASWKSLLITTHYLLVIRNKVKLKKFYSIKTRIKTKLKNNCNNDNLIYLYINCKIWKKFLFKIFKKTDYQLTKLLLVYPLEMK